MASGWEKDVGQPYCLSRQELLVRGDRAGVSPGVPRTPLGAS